MSGIVQLPKRLGHIIPRTQTIERDPYIPTAQEAAEDRALEGILKEREARLVQQLREARRSEDTDAGYRALSEATCYGDEPKWTVEDVEAWADYANRNSSNGFIIGRAHGRGSRIGVEELVGLIRSTVAPTAPLREAMIEHIQHGGTATDVAHAAANELDQLTNDPKTDWRSKGGNQLLVELGMKVSHHGNGEKTSVKSFLPIERAAAIALALNIPPIELGA